MNKHTKELVLARIDACMPEQVILQIGTRPALTKQDVLDHVMAEDEIGEEIAQVHLAYIKAISSGEFTKKINSVK